MFLYNPELHLGCTVDPRGDGARELILVFLIAAMGGSPGVRGESVGKQFMGTVYRLIPACTRQVGVRQE